MLTLNISQADIVTANYERIDNPIRKIRKRMDAIYWASQGVSRQEIAQLSGVHRNSVKNYVKLYNKGGLEALKCFDYKGSSSVLLGHRLTLEAYFQEHPPRTAKEAAAKIETLTGQALSVAEVRRYMHQMGMRPRKTGHVPGKANPQEQQKFLEKKLMPLVDQAKTGVCHLFFMDASHFVLMPYVGILWCFARLFIKAAPGRDRINVLGALNFATRKIETILNTSYVNAQTVADLLTKIAGQYGDKPIYLVLDNARYQHCDYVKELAQVLRIQLVFLPPYSPNLNLIARICRHIKKDVLGASYFDTVPKFHQAIHQAILDINHDPTTQAKISTLITPKFQLFAQNLLS